MKTWLVRAGQDEPPAAVVVAHDRDDLREKVGSVGIDTSIAEVRRLNGCWNFVQGVESFDPCDHQWLPVANLSRNGR